MGTTVHDGSLVSDGERFDEHDEGHVITARDTG